jgi:hypothetical protein
MATFVWYLAKKFCGKKWCQNNQGSNGQEETSPVSHPEILILECEPFFPQEIQNFQMISFILT